MELICIRHTSVDVAPGTCYGQSDLPLKSSFKEEAEAVCKALSEVPAPDIVFTSPLSRCRRLASFCGYPEAEIDPRLIEMDFGEWEMRPYDDFTDPYALRWFEDYMNIPAPGGESFRDLYARVESFIKELRGRRAERAALFTHSGVITSIGIIAGAYPAEEGFRHQPPYGGIVRYSISG